MTKVADKNVKGLDVVVMRSNRHQTLCYKERHYPIMERVSQFDSTNN